MEKIQWGEEYSVGNQLLDEQNKELIELVNEMIESGDHEVEAEILSDILNRLMEYAITHHKEEEAYMQQRGCTDLSSHKINHTKFMEQLSRFCYDTIYDRSNLFPEIRDYLVNWIAFHIFGEDRQSLLLQESSI